MEPVLAGNNPFNALTVDLVPPEQHLRLLRQFRSKESADGGASWNQIGSLPLTEMAVDPTELGPSFMRDILRCFKDTMAVRIGIHEFLNSIKRAWPSLQLVRLFSFAAGNNASHTRALMRVNGVKPSPLSQTA